MKVMLVYQAGTANVFIVQRFGCKPTGRNARRVYQGDFRGAACVALGMGCAGAAVRTAHCNQAGDIADAEWSKDLADAPFADRIRSMMMN